MTLSEPSIQVTVTLFASLREAAGEGEFLLRLPPSLPVGQVWLFLLERFPKLNGMDRSLAWAVNHAYARPDHRLQDGDTVAVMPPISGGCLESEATGG